MSSLNFTLLQEKTPQLYQIAAFAEEYVYSDPQSSIAKARLFAERITTILYKAYRIEVPQASSFVDLLQNEEFRKQVPSVILHKLNFIRKIANGIVAMPNLLRHYNFCKKFTKFQNGLRLLL